MKMIRHVFIYALVLVLLLSLVPLGYAAEEEPYEGDEIVSDYLNASSARVSLSISSSGSGTVSIYCKGKDGTTNISATTYLFGYINGTLQTVQISGGNSVTSSSSSALLSRSYSISVGSGTYYAYTVFTVTRNGQTETIAVTSSNVSH